jgi:signal peptidase I
MYPTLSNGQFVLVHKTNHDIETGDVIVFQTKLQDSKYAIKKVLATGGSTVSLFDGSIWINGIKVSPYTCDDTINKTYDVDDNEYFVIGTNYLVSLDSRDYGPISESQVIGKVVIPSI